MRKKYEPNKKDLERAWTWKKRGATVKVICTKLKITQSQYERARSVFNAYYKLMAREEKNSANTKRLTRRADIHTLVLEKGKHYKSGATKLELKDIDTELLRSYVIAGFTEEKISRLLGITRTTLFNYKKRFPEIAYIINNAKSEATKNVVQALLASTQDRMVDDTAVASYLGEITTKRIKKYVPANFNAQKLWLINNANYANNPKPQESNNKGLLLKMIEKMTNEEAEHSDADDEMDEEHNEA